MPSFRAFRQFNEGLPTGVVASTYGLNRAVADRYFPGDSLHSTIVRALAAARCIPIKEVVESFEVFEAVRRDIRSPIVADLCCGHGLVGILMAAFERRVETVHLCDGRALEDSERTLAAVEQVAPWTSGKVHHHVIKLKQIDGKIPFASALATHACGLLTDGCIELAINKCCPIAVTPCCYAKQTSPAPPVLQRELGLEVASDAERTLRLHQAGYTVKWKYIPAQITPMNRIIIGKPGCPSSR